MRRETLAALRDLCPGLPAAALSDRLHVRCTGSYLRGKKDCGDIDFIIAPPPAVSQPHPNAADYRWDAESGSIVPTAACGARGGDGGAIGAAGTNSAASAAIAAGAASDADRIMGAHRSDADLAGGAKRAEGGVVKQHPASVVSPGELLGALMARLSAQVGSWLACATLMRQAMIGSCRRFSSCRLR